MLNNPIPSPKLNVLSPTSPGLIELPVVKNTEPKKSRFNVVLSPISTPYQTPVQTPSTFQTPLPTPLPGTKEHEEMDYVPGLPISVPDKRRTVNAETVGQCGDKYRLEEIVEHNDDGTVELEFIGHFKTLNDIALKLGVTSKAVSDILTRKSDKANKYVITKLFYVGDPVLKDVYDKFAPDTKVNIIEMFIRDCCDVHKDHREGSAELLTKYNEWAKKKGAPELNCRTLKNELKSNNFMYKKGVARMEVRGLKLKPEHSKLII